MSRGALTRTAALGALLVSCGNPTGSGTVVTMAYGEELIEEGIPADVMDDGWAIAFERFEVTVREVTVGGEALGGTYVVDLSEASDGEGQELGALELAGGEYTEHSFVLERMEVDGSAEKEGATKSFSWVFERPVAYDECEATTTVVDGGVATFQITVHADHLFYDSLVAEQPQLLFQPLADADSDGDGQIEEVELMGTDIGAYDPGSAGGIDDLWAFLQAQVTTLGHVDGEGHCHATLLD